MQKFNEIKTVLESAEKDAEAFYNKGNKAAGIRLRAHMQQLKELAQSVRNQVTELKSH